MTTSLKVKATPSNAGLLALEALLTGLPGGGPGLAADASGFAATGLLAATDGLSVSFHPHLSLEGEEVARAQILRLLGEGWVLRDESLDSDITRFRGVTALPAPGQTPAVAEAWALARTLTGLEGVAEVTPLFAQVVPGADLTDPGVALTDDDPVAVAANSDPDWHRQVMNVPAAWAISRANGHEPGAGVVVAVLDTGYTDHPEIIDRLTKQLGQPQQVRGIDLLDDDDDPRDPLAGGPPFTFPSHGIAVASVIASPEGRQGRSGESLTGIAPAAEVLPVRVTTNVVLLLPNKLIEGVRSAVAAGADVINVSLGMPYYWPALHAAIREATRRGVVVVAASGNFWPPVVYPARYPEVLAVAACNVQREAWRFASSGEAVDVLAPGVSVQRAYSDRAANGRVHHRLGRSTGTTYASACCAGLAALWLARHGGRQQLIAHYGGDAARVSHAFHYLMRRTAERLPDLPPGRYGDGLARADQLLNARLPEVWELDGDLPNVSVRLADPATQAGRAAIAPLADETAYDLVSTATRELLGHIEGEAERGRLQSEASFHLASRPELYAALVEERTEALRAGLLASEDLSRALRQALPAPGGPPAPFRPRPVADPIRRSLKVYAADPSLSASLQTAEINVATVPVPWEALGPGPVGEYLEVVDVDPASQCAYEPVNLDDPRLLANNGLDPSEGDPWFHQQMVYAVAMKTISHFEAALGRPATWAPGRRPEGEDREPFIQRLRIYPHALREQNAYYSPDKRALLFGYFRSPGQGGAPTGPMVFTCLSYDIIAHETAHALLDGMYRYYIEDTNLDVLAFHEAFADLVALFQHFTHPEVLRAAIVATGGNLELDSPLGKLAQQFGEASGRRGALRDAIGETKNDQWQRRQPDPGLLERHDHRARPHLRGSILVAAVFDAFLKIYQRRAQAIIRVGTAGSGRLPPGNLPADLAEALAREAAKTAGHMLNLCIRALDYLPPVDITFGEFLRAVITADRELVPDDPLGYRVALVEAFRAWGIQAEGVSSVAPESLCWDPPEGAAAQFAIDPPLLDQLNRLLPAWRVNRSRRDWHRETVRAKLIFHQALRQAQDHAFGAKIGINFKEKFEVHTLRPATTVGPDGRINPMVVVTLTQKHLKEGELVRTGSTLLFNRGDGQICYAIHKRDTRGQRASEHARHRQFRASTAVEFDPYLLSSHTGERFAGLHLTGRP